MDDVILASKETKLIDSFIQQLKDRDFQLTDEGDLASYLGIAFSRDKTRGMITLKQVGLIDKILKVTGMKIATQHGLQPPPLPWDNAKVPQRQKKLGVTLLLSECCSIWQ